MVRVSYDREELLIIAILGIYHQPHLNDILEFTMSTFNLNAGSAATTPGEPGTIEDTTAVVADKPKAGTEGEQSGTIPTEKAQDIVIQGPLSHVYTQALNLILAKESMGSISQIGARVIDKQEDGEKPKGVYVYVADAKDLQQNDVTSIFSEICAYKEENPDNHVVLGLESVDGFSNAASLLSRTMSDMGVKVYLKRESCIGAIRSLSKPVSV